MLVDTGKIVVRDRIRKDFGDIEELANDIKENGLINPPVVTPDMELIAGERRLRAMKSLGYAQVEVRVMTVQDALHQLKLEISENENRKEFSFSEKMEWAERLKEEYSKIAAANQRAGTSVSSDTQVGRVNDKVAEQVGMSASTLTRSEYIKANADEEMIRQLDDGQLSVNAAYVKLKKKANEAEARLREVEEERDGLVQEAVEATRAAKSATDSREYLRIKDRLAAADEERREYYEKWQAAKKKDKTEEVVTEAENRVKAEYRKLTDSQSKRIEELEERLAESNELKAKLEAIENSGNPDISKQILRVHTNNKTPEQKLNSYEKRLLEYVGGFLSEVRGLEVELNLCPQLPTTTKTLVRSNIEEIKQILTKMDNAIMGGNNESTTPQLKPGA